MSSTAEHTALARKARERTLDPRALAGHELVARSLKDLGVTHVYGISGTPVYETHAACARSGMRVIGVRHQQAGALMAAAQNYVAGRLTAVAILSAGPAITNVTTGILVARDNGWPLLVLGGRRSLEMRDMGSFQDLDAVPIVRPITKFAGLIESPARIAQALGHAFHVAMDGKPGPVYLDICEEALQGKAHPVPASLPRAASGDVDEAALERAVATLTSASRPAIVIGDAVRWAAPFAELAQLVALLNAPFVTSPIARGFLSDDHPLCHNAARSLLLASADVVLAIGAKLDWTFRYGAEIGAVAALIQMSADAGEIGAARKPQVAIIGDIKQLLTELLAKLARQALRCSPDSAWRAQLDAKRRATNGEWEAPAQGSILPMTPQRLILELRDAIPHDAICVVDGNIIMEAAQRLLPSYLPVSRFTPGNNGCMGIGIPFGIGAKLAEPQRAVVVITGDMAFGLSAMEMETAVRLHVPIIVIIANNDGNGGALNQSKFYGEDYADRVTMFAPDIHYEQIMRTFGGHAEFVERPEQVRPAFERALVSGKPACVNVKVNQNSAQPR